MDVAFYKAAIGLPIVCVLTLGHHSDLIHSRYSKREGKSYIFFASSQRGSDTIKIKRESVVLIFFIRLSSYFALPIIRMFSTKNRWQATF